MKTVMTLKEELELLPIETKKDMVKKLKKEDKNIKAGKRKSFYISEYLNHSNVEFVNLLNKNFYSVWNKHKEKSQKFRDDPKNEEKFNLYHKKPKRLKALWIGIALIIGRRP